MRRIVTLAALLLVTPAAAQSVTDKDHFNAGVLIQAYEDCGEVDMPRRTYESMYRVGDHSLSTNPTMFNEGRRWASRNFGHKQACDMIRRIR